MEVMRGHYTSLLEVRPGKRTKLPRVVFVRWTSKDKPLVFSMRLGNRFGLEGREQAIFGRQAHPFVMFCTLQLCVLFDLGHTV